MRSKIRYDLLLKSQKYAKLINHPIQAQLYQTAYNYLHGIRSDVLRNFSNICIHGSFPQMIIPKLQNQTSQFWIHSHLANIEKLSDSKITVLNPQIPFSACQHQQKFDLIVSCLQAHHYDMNKLMENYINKLTPDGAVLGCCWGQNTLKQLKWAYLMAENERSGGVSPKVFSFPSLGEIGQSLTSSKIKMPTIIVQDLEIQIESVVDLLTILQSLGQSGTLQGKRKGVYKDLLLATCAYYDSQFTVPQKTINKIQEFQSNKKVYFSLELGLFIGWKEHENQPKPLTPRKVINNSFFEQLMKHDKDSKFYVVSEESDQPVEMDIKQKKGDIFEEGQSGKPDKKNDL